MSSSGVITGLGLVDVDITVSTPTGTVLVGALAGSVGGGTIRASYATGEISQTVSNQTGHFLGGLTGQLFPGTIEASWSGVNVSSNGSGADIGGLVGRKILATMTASYSVGALSASNGGDVGGLAGSFTGGTVSASYAAGPVSATGTGANYAGISPILGGATITATYWDTNVTGIADDSDTNMPEGKTTSELQSVTGYDTGSIYENWNVNVDGQTGADDPWDFGKAMQYPMLKFGGMSVVAQGSLAMGTPGSNGNNPVVGENAQVCLVNGPSIRASGTQNGKAPWVWQRSTDGKTWSDITEDGGPTWRYTPVSGDVGNHLRACVPLGDNAPEGADEACVRMFAKAKAAGG